MSDSEFETTAILHQLRAIREEGAANAIPYEGADLARQCAACGFIPESDKPLSVLVYRGDRLDFIGAMGLLLARVEVAAEIVARFPHVRTRELYVETLRGTTNRRVEGYVELRFDKVEFDPTLWPYEEITRCRTCGETCGIPTYAAEEIPMPFPVPVVRASAVGEREIFWLGHQYRLVATEEAKRWFVERSYSGIGFLIFGAVV